MISPLQCKLGRTALGWTTHVLAEKAKVAANTVSQFERSKVKPNASTVAVIRLAMEKEGVTFISEEEEEGVKVRRRR
jgi:transcriptional regulator with XRE-family HTH domain